MRKILLFCFVLSALGAKAQQIDPDFKPRFLDYGRINDVTFGADYKPVIAGNFDFWNDKQAGGVVRLNINGETDATFNAGTGAEDHEVLSVKTTADGKLIVGGSFNRFNGVSAPGLVRLNANGTIDNTFTSGIIPTGRQILTVTGAVPQSNGKVIVIGFIDIPTSIGFSFIERLNVDGSKDASFVTPDSSLPFIQYFSKIVVTTDDKILVGGNFNNYGGPGNHNFVRLTKDGAIDNTFFAGLPGGDQNSIRDIFVLPDGKIYAGGSRPMARYASDGTKDDTFAPASPITGAHVVVLSDGSLVVSSIPATGPFPTLQVKYSNTGAVLSSIGLDDFAPGAFYIRTATEERIITGLHTSNPYTTHVVRNTDLSVDNTWPSILVTNKTDEYVKITAQGDKFLLSAGAMFYASGNASAVHLIHSMFRVNNNFSFDDSFNYQVPEDNSNPKVLYVDSNKKIYINEYFINNNYLRRYNADGTFDDTFTPLPGVFNDVAEAGNGNILAIERITTGLPLIQGYVRKISDSGVIDPNFELVSSGQMKTIDATSNGKFYISMASYNQPANVNQTPVKNVFRITGTGVVDNGFVLPASSEVKQIRTQNEKVVIAGNIAGTSIERYNSSGQAELQHDEGTKLKTGNDFILSGDFIYVVDYANGSDFELIRLKMTGETDTRFKPVIYRKSSPGFVNTVDFEQIFQLSPGSLLIRGDALYKIDLASAPPAGTPTQLTATVSLNLEVTLTWIDTNTNESGFEIERAEGNGNFSLIAATDANVLTYTDKTTEDGKSYSYRVRAVNTAGESGYSNVAATGVITGVDEIGYVVRVYPNPVKDFVHVQSDDDIQRFTLFQLDGRTLDTAHPGANEVRINMSSYSPGVYLLRLEFVTGKKVLKIFKQ